MIGPLFSFQHLCIFNPCAVTFLDGKAILLEGNILFVKQDDKMIAKRHSLEFKGRNIPSIQKHTFQLYNYIILSNLFT